MAGPAKLGDLLAELILRRGYARQQNQSSCEVAWKAVVGEALVRYTRPGQIKRGVLEVTVANSALVQELTFQKQKLVEQLCLQLPDSKIRDLRFRVGPLSA